jgi:hypothetical protein
MDIMEGEYLEMDNMSCKASKIHVDALKEGCSVRIEQLTDKQNKDNLSMQKETAKKK